MLNSERIAAMLQEVKMRVCNDGYPTCRNAEATGKWCKGECLNELQKKLDTLLLTREQIREKHINPDKTDDTRTIKIIL